MVKRMGRRVAACAAFSCCLGVVSHGHAGSVIVVLDPGTTNVTTGIGPEVITGEDMAGMAVSVFYENGSFDTVPWVSSGVGSRTGHAKSPRFFLEQRSDTRIRPWTLTNVSPPPTKGGAGLGITRVLIDAGPGNSIFDTTLGGLFGTSGSGPGRTFEVPGILTLPWDIVATYRDEVALTGQSAIGDLFRFLDIEFRNEGGLPGLRSVFFFADTDGILIDGDITPEPDNSPPACTPHLVEPFVATADDVFEITVDATDPDGDPITVSVVGLPPGATYEVEAAGGLTTVTFAWTPTAADKAGAPYEVTFTFTDPFSESDSCSFTIEDVNLPPVCDAGGGATGTLSFECTSAEGALVTLNGSATDADDGDTGLLFHWDVSNLAVVLDDPDSATTSGTFPIGSTMATLTVADGRGGISVCDVTIEVADSMPPEVSCTTSTASLWPPNHKMVQVALVVVATDNCAEPNFVVPIVVTVRSDEPDNATGNGDGNTTGDVDGQDGFSAPVNVTGVFTFDAAYGEHGAWVGTIQLRSERAGTADGRAYTIDVAATDSALNVAQTSCVVVVPHDRRNAI